MLDWEANIEPELRSRHFLDPLPVSDAVEMKRAGYQENWISYGSNHFSAKELTVFPGRAITIRDAAAYGLIVTQGRGRIGKMEVETPTLVRFGERTRDELFVSVRAARAGVAVSNASDTENLVLLKHFGPGNPDAEPLIRHWS
jgi:hypothetical protein